MSAPRPYLLLTNDDGIDAPGIHALADALESEFDLLIVAPHRERSATGHAISVMKDLRLEEFHRKGGHWGWSFQGKPADCVKIALTRVSRDRRIDLVVSGINKGQNMGINILYSGTVAAAREAAIWGIPSMAISLAYKDFHNVSFDAAARVAAELTPKIIHRELPRHVFLNVNIPPVPYDQIEGWEITRQGDSGFRDHFQHVAGQEHDKHRLYRNIGERFAPSSRAEVDLDDHALARNKVSITPLHVDATALHAIEGLRDLARSRNSLNGE